MIRYLYAITATLLLASCSGLGTDNTSGFNVKNTVGRDIDEVVADFTAAGLWCSGKGRDKEVFTNKLRGLVNCGNTEKSLFCPKSFSLSVSFDLETNKVLAFGKRSTDNCF